LSLVKRHSSSSSKTTPSDLQDKILAVAPMVDQSDLPFRLLCRKYGSNLAWTPMIHCKCFQEKEVYRTKFFDLVKGTPPQDRPLIAQLCGSDLQLVLKTAKQLEPFVDGIDLNCGCPQSVCLYIVCVYILCIYICVLIHIFSPDVCVCVDCQTRKLWSLLARTTARPIATGAKPRDRGPSSH
jgi:hypothetical protein